MQIGTIIKATEFAEARKPAYKLEIDFEPEIGLKKSSAQITELYNCEELVGKQIMVILNFPPKQIGPFMSECLVMGVYNKKGVVLLEPSVEVENGEKVG